MGWAISFSHHPTKVPVNQVLALSHKNLVRYKKGISRFDRIPLRYIVDSYKSIKTFNHYTPLIMSTILR